MKRSSPRQLAAFILLSSISLPATLDGQTGTLVVLNKGSATADIIDIATGRTLATVQTGSGPHELAITKDGSTAVGTDYGSRSGGSTLTVIDVPGRRVVRTIDLGRHRRPHGIAFLPGDSLLAVTSEESRHVVIIRVSDGEVVRAIPTDQGGSHMLALIGDGGRIYTSNGGDNSVSELDVGTGRHVRTFAVPPRPEAITVTPSGDEVWVGSNSRGTVSVLNTETGEYVEVLDGFGWPYRILITPDNRLVLIPDLRNNQLRFVDRQSRRELKVLDIADSGPEGITLSGDGKVAFLALSQRDQVAVIDLEAMEIVRYIATGSRPDGIAYSPLVLPGR